MAKKNSLLIIVLVALALTSLLFVRVVRNNFVDHLSDDGDGDKAGKQLEVGVPLVEDDPIIPLPIDGVDDNNDNSGGNSGGGGGSGSGSSGGDDNNDDDGGQQEEIPIYEPYCEGGYTAGYRMINYQYVASTGSKSMLMAVWYPTHETSQTLSYGSGGSLGEASKDARVSECEQFPVIIFSHGLGGCGVQSIFFTEELSRQGYIVMAVDHDDAACSIDPNGNGDVSEFETGLFSEDWDESNYFDRKEDIDSIVVQAQVLNANGDFKGTMNMNKIGFAGHSLGGYTGMGIIGGWESWRNSAFKAALLMSPYSQPFLDENRVNNIVIPVMIQGGVLDIFITPTLDEVYEELDQPKFFLNLKAATHMVWSNTACKNYYNSIECLQKSSKTKAINDYGIAFFDKYLKGENTDGILSSQSSALKSYSYDF